MESYKTKMLAKAVSKKTLPILAGVASNGKQLIATNLDFAVVLDRKSSLEGVYSNITGALTSPELAEQLKIGTLDDFPELPKVPEGEFHPLENLEEIFAAAKTVSTDMTRPPLLYVHIADGWIAATDGYSMYLAETVNSGELWLDKKVVDILKLGKKLPWTCYANEEILVLKTDGITILSKQLDFRYPDVQALVPKGDPKCTIKFNYADFLKAMRQSDSRYFMFDEQGIYGLPRIKNSSDIVKSSPVKLNLETSSETYPRDASFGLFCPLSATVRGRRVYDSKVLAKIAKKEVVLCNYETITEVH